MHPHVYSVFDSISRPPEGDCWVSRAICHRLNVFRGENTVSPCYIMVHTHTEMGTDFTLPVGLWSLCVPLLQAFFSTCFFSQLPEYLVSSYLLRNGFNSVLFLINLAHAYYLLFKPLMFLQILSYSYRIYKEHHDSAFTGRLLFPCLWP